MARVLGQGCQMVNGSPGFVRLESYKSWCDPEDPRRWLASKSRADTGGTQEYRMNSTITKGFLKDLPACAVSIPSYFTAIDLLTPSQAKCVTTALEATSCTVTDQTCICTNQQLLTNALGCYSLSCVPKLGLCKPDRSPRPSTWIDRYSIHQHDPSCVRHSRG